MINSNSPTFIDLFAGAGGLSEGFIRQGFNPIAHVEMDKDACLTLKTRLAYHYLKQKDQLKVYIAYLKKEIARDELYAQIPQKLIDSVLHNTISDETIPTIFNSIDESLGNKKVDVIIGGPPCQAYSLIGRAADKNKMKGDARKFLYRLYAKFLDKYDPKIFIFENVPGLLSSGGGKYLENMIADFTALGYTVEYQKQNAARFGVVQNRNRIIIVGWKTELNLTYPIFEENRILKQVKYIFNDLPELQAGESCDIAYYTNNANQYLKSTLIRNGINFTTQHISRPHNNNDKKIYFKAIELWNDKKKRIKYTDLPESLQTHENRLAFLDRFKVVASELEASHTLVAHISKDGHYYIHPDKKQLRSISVREAARLQSFTDDYFFEGTRTSSFKQIGNAVPPLMAEEIAKQIYKLI